MPEVVVATVVVTVALTTRIIVDGDDWREHKELIADAETVYAINSVRAIVGSIVIAIGCWLLAVTADLSRYSWLLVSQKTVRSWVKGLLYRDPVMLCSYGSTVLLMLCCIPHTFNALNIQEGLKE